MKRWHDICLRCRRNRCEVADYFRCYGAAKHNFQPKETP